MLVVFKKVLCGKSHLLLFCDLAGLVLFCERYPAERFEDGALSLYGVGEALFDLLIRGWLLFGPPYAPRLSG